MNMNQANQFFISYYQNKGFNVYRIFLLSFYIFHIFAINSIMKQKLYLGGQNMLSINQSAYEIFKKTPSYNCQE